MQPLPDKSELERLFRYDAETGALYWNKRTDVRPGWNKRFAGKRAGAVSRYEGRTWMQAGIQGKLYQVSHIVYKMHTNDDPVFIRFRDGDAMNTRFDNLVHVFGCAWERLS